MMKKVLYGVALALLASVSVGSLQSCKDDVNDLATQTSFDLSKLETQLGSEAKRLEGLINAEATARRADIETVKGLINTLDAKHDADVARIDGAISQLNGKVDALDSKLDGLYSNEYIDGKLLAIDNELTALKEFAESMPGQLEEIYMAIEQTQEFLTQLRNELKNDIEELDTKFQAQVEQLLDAMDSIMDKMDKQVTGILIQGVYSPVFGDFRTPLGVKSNILFNWYGYNERNAEIEFPSNMEGLSANGAPALPALTPNKTWTAPSGYYGDAISDVTLGTVYVTLNPINPTSAERESLELSIENSAGVALPWTVTLTPSDYVLKHGYTRTQDNGFYEGEVKMPLDQDGKNIGLIRVALEDELKTSMKDVLKNPSKTTAKALVKAVFDQLQGKIPAYGLRYGWNTGLADETDPGFSIGSYSAVLSQYDLAVATALPLGYNFAKGYEGSAKLPEIGHIENLINKIKENGKMSFELKDIEVGEIKINFGQDLTIDVSGKEGTGLTIVIPNIMIKEGDADPKETTLVLSTLKEEEIDLEKYGLEPGKYEYSHIDGLNDIQEGISTGIVEALNGDIGKTIGDKLQSELQTQINKVIKNINQDLGGQIDKMFDSIFDQFEPYYGKIDKAIDLYNKIANKINNFIANPNAYLQVAAFYSMRGADYGIVSGKASDPTPFVQAGGDSFDLYLSSYTAELIAPACKKYVAISAVKGDDARSLADINSAAGESFNTVLDGNRIKVTVPAAALKKNNVYEFTYQALDFRGYTSTKKFYIEVK